MDPDAQRRKNKDSVDNEDVTYVMDDDSEADSSNSEEEYNEEVDGDSEADDLDAGVFSVSL